MAPVYDSFENEHELDRQERQLLAAERDEMQNQALLAATYNDDDLDEGFFADEPADDTYDEVEPEDDEDDEDDDTDPETVPAPSISEAADPDDSKPPLAGFQSAEDVPGERTGPRGVKRARARARVPKKKRAKRLFGQLAKKKSSKASKASKRKKSSKGKKRQSR